MNIDSERDFFSKGLAVGGMDVLRQVAHWRFRSENYETSAVTFWAIMDYVKRFPAAPIEKVRALGRPM
jgi:hypothetical protein